MEISNAHHQAMASLPLEEILVGCPKSQQQERKVIKPHPEQSPKCPRCESTNTKFCYYNNYSLSQPRYYCKGCRRYWTKGGSLRNVPIGGGCRKNKKYSSSSSPSPSSSSSSSSSSSCKRPQDSNPQLPSLMAPSHHLAYDPSDLTLAFANLHKQPTNGFLLGNLNPSPSSDLGYIQTSPGFLDVLRSGFVDYTTGFNQNDLHSFYGVGCNGGSVQEVEDGIGHEGDVVMPFNGGFDGATTTAVTTTTTATTNITSTHGSCKDLDGLGESKGLMGLQWQLGGAGNNMAVDSGRDYWKGVTPPPHPSSSWHGLVNNSLM